MNETDESGAELGSASNDQLIAMAGASIGGEPVDGAPEQEENAQAMLNDELMRLMEGGEPPAEVAPEAPKEPAVVEKTESRAEQIARTAKREAEARKVLAEAKEKDAKAQALLDAAARIKEGTSDPEELLAMLGTSYKDLTLARLTHGKGPEDAGTAAKREVEALRAEIAAEKAQLAAEKKAHEAHQLETTLVSKARELVDGSGDKYDAIAAEGGYEAVVEIIKAHWAQTADAEGYDGELLTVEQAADKLESFLAARAERLAKTKYARGAISATSAMNQPPRQGESGRQTGPARLTNSISSISPTPGLRNETKEDATAALLAFLSD